MVEISTERKCQTYCDMKNNFLLEKTLRETIEPLTKEEKGELFQGILDYVNNEDPKLEGALKSIFIPIKKEIDKNEERYQKICDRNKQNGSLGGRKKEEPKETQNNPLGSFGKNTHISYINNHLEDKELIGYGEEEEKKPLVTDEASSLVEITKKVIKHLNDKTGSKFKDSTKSTRSKINARLNEGYVLDNFIVVIDKKYNEWKGTEFEQYLCPETLFGTKFETYLNQKINKKRSVASDWLGKKIEKEEVSEAERKELEELLKPFKTGE